MKLAFLIVFLSAPAWGVQRFERVGGGWFLITGSTPIYRTGLTSTGTVITPEGREVPLEAFVRSGDLCKWRGKHAYDRITIIGKNKVVEEYFQCSICGGRR